MTVFTTPMARQFVGFDSLFDELNKMAERKESNYPSYNIAKDDDEHYRIEVALAGFSSDDISIQTEKGVLTIEAKKEENNGEIANKYIHRGIAPRQNVPACQRGYDANCRWHPDGVPVPRDP